MAGVNPGMRTLFLHSMSKKFNRQETLTLVSLLVFAASVRIYLACVTYVIQRDGVTYVTLARMIVEGKSYEALAYPLAHPLYPVLMARLGGVIGNCIFAGTVISIVLGTLTLVPFYLLGRELVGKTAATIALALLAIHPYQARFSATVLADPTYIFFVCLSLWLAYRQVSGKAAFWGMLAGIAVGLAYLTKPEGMALLPVVILPPMIIAGPIAERLRKLLLSVAVVLAGFASVAFPYLLFLRQLTGGWVLTQKIRVGELTRIGGSQAGILANAYEWLRTFTETLHPLFLLVLLAGIVCRGQVPRRRQAWYGLAFVVLFGILTLLRLTTSGLLSKRQVLPIALVCLWWSGVGVVELAGLASKLRRRGKTRTAVEGGFRATLNWKLLLILTGALVVMVGIKTLKPQGRDKLPLKLTGEWIAKHWKAPCLPRVFHWGQSRPVFYADAYRFDSDLADKGLRSYREVLEALEARNADLFVAQASRLEGDIPGWPDDEGLSGMSLAHRQPIKRGDCIMVLVLERASKLLSATCQD